MPISLVLTVYAVGVMRLDRSLPPLIHGDGNRPWLHFFIHLVLQAAPSRVCHLPEFLDPFPAGDLVEGELARDALEQVVRVVTVDEWVTRPLSRDPSSDDLHGSLRCTWLFVALSQPEPQSLPALRPHPHNQFFMLVAD